MRTYDEMTLGKKIETLRKLRGISQADLAKALDVSQGLVSFWERGKHTPSFVHGTIMARLFRVPIDHLANETDDRTEAQLADELKARDVIADIGWREAYRRLINAPNGVAALSDTKRYDDPPERAKDVG